MKNHYLLIEPRCMILAACMILLLSVSTEAEQQQLFTADLIESINGAERNCGDATFTIGENGTIIHYKMTVEKVTDVTMAHLHLGEAEVMGSPVVWLYPESPPPKVIHGVFTGTLYEGTISESDLIGPLRGRPLDALIRNMRAGRIYVNIHTLEHSESAVSGVVK